MSINSIVLSDENGIPLRSNFVSADATLTRPADTTPTVVSGAIGSSLSALFKWTGFFDDNGGNALLTGMRLVISASGIAIPSGISIRAHLYNADVSATALSSNADKATFKTMVANAASKLGYVDFASFTIGGSGSDCIESYGTPILTPLHLKAAATASDLYAILVATAVYTPVSASVHTLAASRASM